mgnify:CR=1 FL=1
MTKVFTLLSLVLFLTVSVLGPSFIAMVDFESDIELVQDYEEESSKDSKKEVEEIDKIFEKQHNLALSEFKLEVANLFFYQETRYGLAQDVHSPPPRKFYT